MAKKLSTGEWIGYIIGFIIIGLIIYGIIDILIFK